MERYTEEARPDTPLEAGSSLRYVSQTRKWISAHDNPGKSQEADSTLQYMNQIRKWISVCDNLHPDTCVPKPISKWPPGDVPLWLIDTHRQCIVPGLSARRYLALSYVWPESRASPEPTSPASRTLLLDKANVKILQKPGFLSDMEITDQIPNIIKHAMKFARALGERYLWVDRLCIIQDDVGDGGTLSQVAKMDKIYAGAYFTIVAAAPEEMYEDDRTFETLVSHIKTSQHGENKASPSKPRTKSHYEDHLTTPRRLGLWNPLNRTAWGVSLDDSLVHQQSFNRKNHLRILQCSLGREQKWDLIQTRVWLGT